MTFGIDLGTTNSLIGIGDRLLTGLVSSNVDMSNLSQVDRDYISDDVVSSYKTDMSMGSEGQLSVKASTVILKELARIGTRRYGEEVKDVVISVPAYFTTSQREAVYKAAKDADLNVKCLVNEPTAAAIYLCKDIKDLVVVYDLGGGTFDVSIVDTRMGNYTVIATDGIVLGGDDFDRALANAVISELKIPIRYRNKLAMEKLRFKMRIAKEEIQKLYSAAEPNKNNTVYVDLSDMEFLKRDDGSYEGWDAVYELTTEKYKQIERNVFGKTIDMTRYLISKEIPSVEQPKVIFVGGSSACPYLRNMLCDELQLQLLPCDTKPDLVVAQGVSMYAKMIDEGIGASMLEDVTKRLCIEDTNGKGITVIESNTMIPCTNSMLFNNDRDTTRLQLKLYQGDSIIAANNAYIGELRYDYGREVKAEEGAVEITVSVSADGIISLEACEVMFGTPQRIELSAR